MFTIGVSTIMKTIGIGRKLLDLDNKEREESWNKGNN